MPESGRRADAACDEHPPKAATQNKTITIN
jgi:hypothetical protein